MYQNLLFAVKKRILDEVIDGFNRHPAYSNKVKIYHKFPYEERIQYGVLLRNTSASQIRMSADNYMADVISHVRLARDANYPGYSIEWVRENSLAVTKKIEEDVSDQLSPTQRRFFTTHQILAGRGNTHFADNVGQVKVIINGVETLPEFVNGENKIVMLHGAPAQGAIVKVTYWYRIMSDPGIYVIDFTEDNQFVVAPIYIIEDEKVIQNTSGTEVTANLDHQLVYPGSEDLYLQSENGGSPVWLKRDTDYTIDYPTGLITFLIPLEKSFNLLADYRYQPGDSWGPYTFRIYQEIHEAIPGVVICMGRRAKKGDRQIVLVSKYREQQAKIYGGHWDMSLSLAVIAKDPIQMEEMADHLVNYLWGQRKNVLEYEGITLSSVQPTGESEETFIDLTGDLYYETSVDVAVMTEWQEFVPYFYEIRKIPANMHLLDHRQIQDYKIDVNLSMTPIDLTPDTRRVIKYGVTSYERVS